MYFDYWPNFKDSDLVRLRRIPPAVCVYLRQLSRQRNDIHVGQSTHRPLSNDYELTGIVGEWGFGQEFDLPMDVELRPGGDYGYDYIMPLRGYGDVPHDAKAAIQAYNLIVETHKLRENMVYVLYAYFPDDPAVISIGWEWGSTLKQSVPREFSHGILDYYVPAGLLRPMQELHDLRVK